MAKITFGQELRRLEIYYETTNRAPGRG